MRRTALTLLVSSFALGSCGDDERPPQPDAAMDASVDASIDAPAIDGGAPDAPTSPSVGVVQRAETYGVRVTADVEYGRGLRRRSWDDAMGTEVSLELDVYEPEGAPSTPRPAVVVIHGGGFSGGSRTQRQIVDFARYFASRGWVAFAPTYRVARDFGSLPDTWPDPGSDVTPDQHRAFYPAGRDLKAAVRWTHAHAADYGISEDHVAVIGGSAGSALALMLGVTDPSDYRDELTIGEDPTLDTTNLGARSDVHTVIDHWGAPRLIEVVEAIGGPDRWQATDAPISIVHGRSDPVVPFTHAEAVRDHAERVGLGYAFHPFDGGHGAWNLDVDGQNLHELAFDFIVEQQSLSTE